MDEYRGMMMTMMMKKMGEKNHHLNSVIGLSRGVLLASQVVFWQPDNYQALWLLAPVL